MSVRGPPMSLGYSLGSTIRERVFRAGWAEIGVQAGAGSAANRVRVVTMSVDHEAFFDRRR
ncbi:hypothetical protein [Rhodococcus marinonascens]|uniref:hypothetical protein n=1 Tax=Rhodococcus marinonascens TaxID=38311 RepID=UPI000AC713E8|nr:hypothetical protein [Rhodococcus marinonascens]